MSRKLKDKLICADNLEAGFVSFNAEIIRIRVVMLKAGRDISIIYQYLLRCDIFETNFYKRIRAQSIPPQDACR